MEIGDYQNETTHGSSRLDHSGFDYGIIWELKVANDIRVYAAWFILIPGLIGNTLSFIIYNRSTMSHTVTSVFFRALAIIDSCYLLLSLPRLWLIGVFDLDIQNVSTILCKVYPFLTNIFRDMSGWILTLVAFERLIGVMLPHKHNILFTKMRAKISLGIVCILLAGFYSVILVASKVVIIDYGYGMIIPFCETLHNISHFYLKIFEWFERCIYCLIPFLSILVCNILIIYFVLKAASRRNHQMGGQHQGQRSHTSALTITLMAISFTYVLLTAPYVVYSSFSVADIDRSINGYAQIYLLNVVAGMLSVCNSAVNFALYCISGPGFRCELIQLFCQTKSDNLK